MKVKDLIKILQEFNQELLVVIDGYEGGYCDIATVRQRKMVINYKVNRIEEGPHESLEEAGAPDNTYAPYSLDQIEDTIYIG